MSVHTKPDGRHYVKYYVTGKKNAQFKYFGRGDINRLLAEKFDESLKAEKKKLKTESLTVEEILSQYFENHTVEESTARSDFYKIQTISSLIGNLPAEALTDAHKRGVKVDAILDKSNRTQKYSSADFLAHAGIPVRIDAAHAIAHNKIMILDGETVITGSFNFTKAAEERNAENLLVIRDKGLAGKYAENWRLHAGHSEEYQGR